MAYLIALAILALVFGLVLLFTPGFLMKAGDICNRIIMYLDEKLQPYRIWVGLGLVLVGAWVLYIVTRYPELSQQLNAVWIVALAFGLLFLFFQNWLSWLSNVSNRVILSTDDVVIGARKIVGVVLLIASIYIFWGAYMVR